VHFKPNNYLNFELAKISSINESDKTPVTLEKKQQNNVGAKFCNVGIGRVQPLHPYITSLLIFF
jgi:hypothetical protein